MADEGRKRRFVQEARAASALNHPNIVTIHEIESAEGVDFTHAPRSEGRDYFVRPESGPGEKRHTQCRWSTWGTSGRRGE